jgi:hypothetical protein
MRVMKQFSSDKNADHNRHGVRLNRLVYKAMVDIDQEQPQLNVYSKNKRTVEIAAAYISNLITREQAASQLDGPGPEPTPCFDPPILDGPIGDIDSRIAALTRFRSDVEIGDPYSDYRKAVDEAIDNYGSAASVLRPDLSNLRANIGTACDDPSAVGGIPEDGVAGAGGSGGGSGGAGGEDTILPGGGNGPKRLVDRYLMINGYDRSFGTYPQRFTFNVNLANNDANFKDIRSIAATRLIIPREIVQERTITNVPKTQFEYPFGLPFPYLILKVADFQNVYKASNDASQSAFCHFVFETYYSSPSGRGYIHMVPMQNEKLMFDINPLAALSQITMSVMRPSGALLNESRDETKILRMDWNNQVNSNQQLIMITLKQFYDRNEFYTGDTVRFTGFSSTGAITGFINRAEGHDIMEFGTPNIDGYIDSFYIRVPGAFNTTTGLFNTDTAATTELMDYINLIDYETTPPDSIALVINATLQVAVSFRVVVEEDDVTM